MKIENSIRSKYKELKEYFLELQKLVVLDLKPASEKNGWLFMCRIKAEESFALKLATGREIDDFFGCSIIVHTLTDIEKAKNLVSGLFHIQQQRPGKIISSRPTEFQFDSLRLYCNLKKSVNPTPLHDKKFEVQVKTLLEHAWSQATHDFSYKSSDISWAKERLAAQLKAMLDNIELSLSEIKSLSSSSILQKQNKEYNKKNEILLFLRDELGSNESILLPSDMRRLTDITYNLLKHLNNTLSDLRCYLEKETEKGRGTKTKNLSIYSVILTTLLYQNKTGFINMLSDSRRNFYIFIPKEIEVPSDINLSDFHKIKNF